MRKIDNKPTNGIANTSSFDRFASLAKRIVSVKKSDLPEDKSAKKVAGKGEIRRSA